MRRLTLIVTVLAPTLAHAAKPAAAAAAATPPASGPGRLLWITAGLLAAMAALLLWMRRRGQGWSSGLRIIEQMAIGKGRSLVVVEYHGRHLLLGSTEGGIRVLHSTAAPEPQPAVQPDEEESFDAILEGSVEQQELSMKLQEGIF